MNVLNPYTAGNPIKNPANFFGREDVFRVVKQELSRPNSNAIVLYGQRRIGKTSVLLQLQQRLQTEEVYTPVYFDLQDKASMPLGAVLFELAHRIAYVTGQAMPEANNFDSEGEYFRHTFLPSMVAAACKGGLVLLFDEFDVLDSPADRNAGQVFFPYLRQWMTEVEGVQFVFVIGRRPEDLSIATLSAFKGIRADQVSLFTKEDTEAVVRKSEGIGGLDWSKEAIQRVWDWAHGHPYFTQLICSVIWDNLHQSTNDKIPVAQNKDVDASIDEAIKQGANAFQWIWDGLPPAERVVTSAISSAGDKIITQEEIADILRRCGVRLIVRELELAPETLVNWGVLEPAGAGYRFLVSILRRWVAEKRPLERVKDELDRLDPIAEEHFQLAHRYYQLNQPQEAEIQATQSLRINPNHLKSRLLLGRILLEAGREGEAVAILEEAYQYDDKAARSGLIQALLAHAEKLDEESELSVYERVLEIDPNQSVASERAKTIFMKRGELALKQEDFESALAYFQKAGSENEIERVRKLQIRRIEKVALKKAKDYEKAENWEAAVALYQNMIEQFPESDELQANLKNAQEQELLKKYYTQALGALSTGDTATAMRLLADVISRKPDYKDASLHLVRSTSGIDVIKLQQQLDDAKNAYQDALHKIKALEEDKRKTAKELEKRSARANSAEASYKKLQKKLTQMENENRQRVEGLPSTSVERLALKDSLALKVAEGGQQEKPDHEPIIETVSPSPGVSPSKVIAGGLAGSLIYGIGCLLVLGFLVNLLESKFPSIKGNTYNTLLGCISIFAIIMTLVYGWEQGTDWVKKRKEQS